MRTNPRLRVGVVMNTFVRSEGVNAGGHVHVFEVVERWLELSLDVVVFAPAFVRDEVKKRLPSVEFIAMPSIEPPTGGRIVPFLSRAASALLRRAELRRCDALFASSQLLPDVVPLLCARKAARVVFIAHVLEAPWQRRGSLLRNALASVGEDLGLRVSNIGAGAIVTCSHFVAAQLRLRGMHQPCYVSTNGAGHVRRSYGPGERSGGVSVARLHPVKGVEDLIRAWRKVVDAIPGATLTIVGDGEPAYRERLEALGRSLDLEGRLIFAGSIDDATRDELLARSAIFMFASYEEGWGIAVAEALTASLPCVTYDLPIFQEIFPRGRLAAPVGDIGALASHAITLLRDASLRDKLAKEASELSEQFSWEHAAVVDARALLETLLRSLHA